MDFAFVLNGTTFVYWRQCLREGFLFALIAHDGAGAGAPENGRRFRLVNDMVENLFAAFGGFRIEEEFGFIGTCTVIILLILISIECIIIARRAKDTAGLIIASGMGSLIALQGFMNIGVATQVFPNTGLPLPFVSYGTTSLVSMYIGLGLVLNVRLTCNIKTSREGIS